jgi:hypothetical protein
VKGWAAPTSAAGSADTENTVNASEKERLALRVALARKMGSCYLGHCIFLSLRRFVFAGRAALSFRESASATQLVVGDQAAIGSSDVERQTRAAMYALRSALR